MRDWPGYFDLMVGKPPRETLVAALARFAKEEAGCMPTVRRAVDLGCGEGRDTLELLAHGWQVLAIDGHPRSFELLKPRVSPEHMASLQTSIAPFREARWPRGLDLLNASFALPFCEPDDWNPLWERIVTSIRPGGRFSGQLFGDRDGWAALPDRTHHRRAQLDSLFSEFTLEELREEERADTNHDGKPKPWHVFHIVARKRIP